jgi:S-adenosylmethionine/arginine decarboxylase-like enzyme
MSNITNPSGYKPWGKSISINLFECNLQIISNPSSLERYIQTIIEKIEMVAHGPCHIERFGIGLLEGYSAMQFIETSSITVHCDEPGLRCFIDIFSCKDFDTKLAKRVTTRFFQAKRATSLTLDR